MGCDAIPLSYEDPRPAMNISTDDRQISRFLEAWFGVRQIIQAANFNHFHKAGLSATQFMILNLLPEADEGMSMSAIAARTNLKPATIAKTVDSLQERGMVVREKSAADGRLVLVKITGGGRRLQNTAVGQFRTYVTGLFRAMPVKDRKALIVGLESLVRSAAQNGEAPR